MTTQTKTQIPDDIREAVRERYGRLAEEHKAGTQADCGCATEQSSCCAPESAAQFDTVMRLYEDGDVFELPVEITEFSLGCGDPITLASLEEGQAVLDLGSGGGLDCFLAAKKVGPTGKVIGVDMTASMIEKARANKAKIGAENVEFRLGEIEHLPVPDDSVDVIISNCVINLSPDKPQVFRETFRALRPGGRIAVSDIVTDGPLPEAIKNDLTAWAGCIAGALDVKDYIAAIEDAGFEDVELTHVYWDKETVNSAVEQLDLDLDPNNDFEINQDTLYKTVFSAKISARKPQ
jgi:arsenite methyltransferase